MLRRWRSQLVYPPRQVPRPARRTPIRRGRCISWCRSRPAARSTSWRARSATNSASAGAASIIIENRPGAGGTIAAEAAAKSPPDGYTLVVVASGHAIVPFLYPKLPLRHIRRFHADLAARQFAEPRAGARRFARCSTLADLIAAARAKPGQLSYGHAGNGTSPHLAGELLKASAKIDITAVPYKGGAAGAQRPFGRPRSAHLQQSAGGRSGRSRPARCARLP